MIRSADRSTSRRAAIPLLLLVAFLTVASPADARAGPAATDSQPTTTQQLGEEVIIIFDPNPIDHIYLWFRNLPWWVSVGTIALLVVGAIVRRVSEARDEAANAAAASSPSYLASRPADSARPIWIDGPGDADPATRPKWMSH